MGNGPAPFSDIGKRAKDLLTKDYNYDHKFTFSVPSSTGMGLTATGVKRDQIFVGDISTQYKRGNTTVDVKVDTYSNVCTKVTMNDILPSTKAAFSFDIPDHKSGKLDVQYLHDHAAINSSIGLNPAPLLEVAAALGNKDLFFGGEIGFDTASASFTKHNAGIGFNKTDFCVALILTARDGERLWLRVIGKAKKKRLPDMDLSNPPVLKLLNRVQCLFSVEITLMDKGQTLKASYIHTVNPLTGTEVAAEMTHRFSKYENSFTIGSSHTIDPYTTIKTRFSDNGKVAMLCQREWRPKSLVTFSAEYDSKAINAAPKLGLALALKP